MKHNLSSFNFRSNKPQVLKLRTKHHKKTIKSKNSELIFPSEDDDTETVDFSGENISFCFTCSYFIIIKTSSPTYQSKKQQVAFDFRLRKTPKILSNKLKQGPKKPGTPI